MQRYARTLITGEHLERDLDERGYQAHLPIAQVVADDGPNFIGQSLERDVHTLLEGLERNAQASSRACNTTFKPSSKFDFSAQSAPVNSQMSRSRLSVVDMMCGRWHKLGGGLLAIRI
jgi:hypothetical protein